MFVCNSVDRLTVRCSSLSLEHSISRKMYSSASSSEVHVCMVQFYVDGCIPRLEPMYLKYTANDPW